MTETKTVRTRNTLSPVEKDKYLKLCLSMLLASKERTDIITVVSARLNMPRSSATNLVNEAHGLFQQELEQNYDPRTDTVKGPLTNAAGILDKYRRKPVDGGDPFAGFFVDLPHVHSGPALAEEGNGEQAPDDAPLDAESAEEAFIEASAEMSAEAADGAPAESNPWTESEAVEPAGGNESPAPAETHGGSRKGRKSR